MMVPRVTPKARPNPYGSQAPDVDAMEKTVGRAISRKPGGWQRKPGGWRGAVPKRLPRKLTGNV